MITIIGFGIKPKHLSLEALEALKRADKIFLETYTNVFPPRFVDEIKQLVGIDNITPLNREALENNLEEFVETVKNQDVVLLVQGDPMFATTHVNIVLECRKRNIPCRVLSGISIYNRILASTGLQPYRFGRIVSIPLLMKGYMPESPYLRIAENIGNDLHTLVLLEAVSHDKFLSISGAIDYLLRMESRFKRNVVTEKRFAIGIARLDYDTEYIKCDRILELRNIDFGPPPHTLILLADSLHFLEAEALVELLGAPAEIKRLIK